MKTMNKMFCSLLIMFTLIISITTQNAYATTSLVQQEKTLISQETINVSNIDSNTLGNSGTTIISNSVTVRHSLYCDNIKRIVYHEYTIVDVKGAPPLSLLVFQFLQKYNTYNVNRLTDIDDADKSLNAYWEGPDIKVGATRIAYVPAETKYWGIYADVYATYPGSTPFSINGVDSVWLSSLYLVNRTGNAFPDYQDPWSKKKASAGIRTDWQKTLTPVEWNKTIRGQKIKEYIDTYGDPKWDWSKYDLHHIRPRAYGGTNDISNLMAIPRIQHNAISGWFNGYSTNSLNVDPIDD